MTKQEASLLHGRCLDLCLHYQLFLLLSSQPSHTACREDSQALAMTGSPRPCCYPVSFGWVLHLFVSWIPLLLVEKLWSLWMFTFAAISLEPGPAPGTEQVHPLWMNERNEWINGWFAFIWQNNVLASITTKMSQENNTKQRLTWITIWIWNLSGSCLFKGCSCWCGDYLLP